MSLTTPPSRAVPSTPVRNRSSTFNRSSPRTPSSTPSTPYTISQFSSRSFSSILTTPSSVNNSPVSPLHAKSNQSIADLTENWRERAQLNGIKVSAADSDEHASKGIYICAICHASSHVDLCSTLCQKKIAFLPSPGFSSNLRRTFKPSPFSSPVSSARRSSSAYNTPSPKTNFYQSRGSFTAPPQPRRRSAYDSQFSDASEDDEVGSTLPSVLPSLWALQDLSILEEPECTPVLQDLVSTCSVCDKQPSDLCRMIVLSPCSHIFCATCFTGTLNIVGEKNMSCMECHSTVESFHFALGSVNTPSSDATSETAALLGGHFGSSFPSNTIPKSGLSSSMQRDSIAVLRIDNVPWDVTPLIIKAFIKHPIIRAHVLLDLNGKTLSHAFVQLLPEDARAALRSSQNTILGQGRRARAVTVTLSSQEELMAALYPHWRGSFDGCKPSLDNLDNEQVNEALQHGLISNAVLDSLLTLISNPNSHFLKVPSLPYYSLISILSTFPSDVDSRVFWSGQLRDSLFRITHAAFKALVSRTAQTEEESDLWEQLKEAGINCRAFIDSQITALKFEVDSQHAHASSEEYQTRADLKPPIDILDLPMYSKSSVMFNALADRLGLESGVLAAILQSR